jgi:hypothetical protein
VFLGHAKAWLDLIGAAFVLESEWSFTTGIVGPAARSIQALERVFAPERKAWTKTL